MTSYEDAVFAACKYGHMEDIEDLLKDAKAKWNLHDELGNTPLHYAAGTPSHSGVATESRPNMGNLYYLTGRTQLHSIPEPVEQNRIYQNF